MAFYPSVRMHFCSSDILTSHKFYDLRFFIYFLIEFEMAPIQKFSTTKFNQIESQLALNGHSIMPFTSNVIWHLFFLFWNISWQIMQGLVAFIVVYFLKHIIVWVLVLVSYLLHLHCSISCTALCCYSVCGSFPFLLVYFSAYCILNLEFSHFLCCRF